MASSPVRDRIRLNWSITTTCSGLSPSTLAARRLTMAWVFSSGRILEPFSLSSTDALASSFSVTKGLSLLGEMCTVAWATCWMDMMVRASSASMALRYMTFWVKSVVVRLGDLQLFEADALAPGEPFPGELEAQFADPVLRHGDAPLVLAQLVLDVGFLQLVDDPVGVHRRQVGEQGPHGLLAGPDAEPDQAEEHGQGDGRHHALLGGGHVLEGLLDLRCDAALVGHGFLSPAGNLCATSASASRRGRHRPASIERPSSSGN